MTIRDFIQLSILKPNKIWTILQKPLKKIKGIFFLLVLLVSIPGFIRAGKDIGSINSNLEIVANSFQNSRFKMVSYRRETIRDLFTVQMYLISSSTLVGNQRIMM